MKSKFLDQDIDVVFLANKCIIIGGFVIFPYLYMIISIAILLSVAMFAFDQKIQREKNVFLINMSSNTKYDWLVAEKLRHVNSQ